MDFKTSRVLLLVLVRVVGHSKVKVAVKFYVLPFFVKIGWQPPCNAKKDLCFNAVYFNLAKATSMLSNK